VSPPRRYVFYSPGSEAALDVRAARTLGEQQLRARVAQAVRAYSVL
jgi:hypothetical protein